MLRVALAGLAGLLLATSALAQPSPAAEATPAVRQACVADGNRLCAGVPREPRQMTRCILQHWSELGASCKAAIIARRNEMRAHPDQTAPAPPSHP